METSLSHQQKIERLETEKRQLENRIRQLKHAAHTAERKRLTRAKIILGSLVLRNHAELLRQLITRGFSAGWRTSAVGLSQCNEGRLTFIGSVSVGGDFGKDIAKLPEPFNKGEAHVRVAGVSPRCPCVSAICGKGSLPLARHPIFFPKSRKASLVIWRSFISRSGRSAGLKDTVPLPKSPMTRDAN
jgi:hypothetical protein